MSFAKAKAREIVEELSIDKLELLFELKAICCSRGVFVKKEYLTGAEARLLVRGRKGIITISDDIGYSSRERYGIAHELGHFELHASDNGLFMCNEQDMNDWFRRAKARNMECEANEFAAELLMPEKFIKPKFEDFEPSLDGLEEISNTFRTSLFATARRFIDLTNEACALVFYNERGSVVYVWKSSYFDEQKYWIERGALSPYSYAYDAFLGKDIPDCMSAVDVTSWFEVPEYLSDKTIQEQSKYFKNLTIGMSLLWIKDGSLIRY